MCANCNLLEQRVEALEAFVWERMIASKCNHNENGVCANFDDIGDFCHCHVSICTDKEWETRG